MYESLRSALVSAGNTDRDDQLVMFAVRIPAEDHVLLKSVAALLGRSVSDVARECLQEGARERLRAVAQGRGR